MHSVRDMPIHPSMRHPLTGQPLQAVYVDRHGRARYPMIGASQDPNPAPDPEPAPAPPAPTPSPSPLGFPENTPVAEMTADEKAAYDRHQREQNRQRAREWRSVTGDRTPEQLRQDLEDLEAYRQAEKTPAQQAIDEAERRGREAAITESTTKAAKAILRATLQTQGIEDSDDDEELTDLVESIDVTRFIVDGDIDTDKLSRFAKRFNKADTAETPRTRDFGGGRRREGDKPRGAGGKAEAARRFKKSTTEA